MAGMLKRGNLQYIIPLGAMYLSQYIDSSSPSVLLATRVCFFALTLAQALAYVRVGQRVRDAHDESELRYADSSVKPKKKGKRKPKRDAPAAAGDGDASAGAHPQAGEDAAGGEERPMIVTTVHAYDMAQLRKEVMSVAIGAVVLAVMHFGFGMYLPLLVSCFQSPASLFDSPLVAVHLLRNPAVGEFARPFGEPPGLVQSLKDEFKSLRAEATTLATPDASLATAASDSGAPVSAAEAAAAFRKRFNASGASRSAAGRK